MKRTSLSPAWRPEPFGASLESSEGASGVGARTMENVSDEVLLSRFLEGAPRAFSELLERHRRAVYYFILRYTKSRETADELLQDVFLRVVDGARRFEQRSKVRTWIFTIARNLCIDHARRMRHRRTTSLDHPGGPDEEGPTLLDRLSSAEPTPAAEAERSRLRKALQEAIATLNPEQREVLLMREEVGLQFDEIARIVGAPVNTVKSRMRYALENLRAGLEAQGIEP